MLKKVIHAALGIAGRVGQAEAFIGNRSRDADSVHTPGMRSDLLLVACAYTLLLSNQSSAQSDSSPIGTWRGDSTCVVRPSACNDEDSKYRFVLEEGTPDRVRLAAAKIVNKREVLMGTSDCRYDSQKHALDCPLPNETAMHFDVNGSTMKGTMKLRDGTLWRKIALHRIDEK
jgi:hypothetical protein